MSNDVQPTTDARVAAFLQAGRTHVETDSAQAQLDIVRRIVAAESVEDILGEQTILHAKDVLGRPLIITGYHFTESDFDDQTIDFYMIFECVTPNGEPYPVTCGAVNAMAQLYALADKGALPIVAQLVETEKPTKKGYRPIWLRAINVDHASAFDPFAVEKDF